MGVMRKVLSLVFFLVLLIFMGCTKDKPLSIGKQAPNFSLIDINENIHKLSDYKGKLVILRFWQKNCPACLKEMPLLSDFYVKYKKDLVVLAVDMGDPLQFILAFTKEQNLKYPMLSDKLKIATEKYDVLVSPTTYIVDKQGILRGKIMGNLDEDTFSKKILSYL